MIGMENEASCTNDIGDENLGLERLFAARELLAYD